MTGPQLERRNPNTVLTEPLPGVRVPTNIPSSALGVSHPLDFSEAERAVSEIAQEHWQKASNLALLDADNQAAKLQADLHAKALQHRGKDALGAVEAIQGDWQKGVSEITRGLHTDQQREAFASRVSGRWESLYGAVETHAANQYEQYKRDTFDSSLALAENDAATNYTQPQVLDEKLNHVRAVVAEAGDQFGWSTDMVKDKTLEATSRIHVGVIHSMIDKEDDLSAISYFQAHEGEMSFNARNSVESPLQLGSTRVESAHRADAITATAVGEAQAFSEVAKIPNIRVRDETHQRVEQFFQDRQRTLVQTRAQAYQRASQAVMQSGGRLSAVSRVNMDQLDGSEIISLSNTAWDLRNPKAERRVTDDSVVAELLTMANGSETSRNEFKHLDLSKYKESLSEPMFLHFLNVQAALQGRNVNAQEAATRKAEALRAKRAADVRAFPALGKYIDTTAVSPPVAHTVPGGPIAPAATPEAGNPPKVNSKPPLMPADLARSKRDPKYREWLIARGYRVP